jgi:hypothetical protein
VKTDESTIGVWLWLVFVVWVGGFALGADLWLRAHGHEYLTTEFREGLKSPLWGPILAGATAFVVVAFVWHMFIGKGQ